MAGYNSIHKGSVIDATVSAVIAGKAGLQGVKVNGTEVTPDPDTNKVDLSVPNLLNSTGQSTTAGMTQSAITTALNSKADSSGLSEVATSGSYNDLSDKPTIPTLLSTTGQSTTSGMTQKAITDAIGSSVSGVAGVKVNGVELEKDDENKVDVPVPVLQSTTGSSTTAGMTQNAITTALADKVSTSSVVQSTGTSITNIMSQKAVTDALGTKANSSSLSSVATSGSYNDLSNKPTIPALLSTTGSSTTDGMTQSAITTALGNKVNTSSVVQSTGTSTTNIMSQNAVSNQLNAKATVTTYSATLSTSWTGSSAPYTQTVSVSGILSTDVPIVDVVLSSTTSTAISQLEAWSCVSKITTSSGSITATCLAEKPTSSIPIQLLVVR